MYNRRVSRTQTNYMSKSNHVVNQARGKLSADLRKWLDENNIEEIEAVVPDMTGVAKGKILPAKKYQEDVGLRLPESIFGQTVEGEYPKEWNILSEEDGALPVSPHIPEEQTTSTYFTNIYPCTQFVFAPDSMWWLAVRPESAERSRLEVGSCFPADVISRPDFEQNVQAYFERLDTATPEDNTICEAQQAGSHTIPFVRGRFGKEEALVHALANWVLDQVLRVAPRAPEK